MKKLYYSISEISKIMDEEQHILRYWEKEFEILKPRKNRAGKRVYSGKDLTVLKIIKKLLRDDKLSLKGAKEKLSEICEDPKFAEIEKNVEIEHFSDEPPVSNNGNADYQKNDQLKREIVSTLQDIVAFLKSS